MGGGDDNNSVGRRFDTRITFWVKFHPATSSPAKSNLTTSAGKHSSTSTSCSAVLMRFKVMVTSGPDFKATEVVVVGGAKVVVGTTTTAEAPGDTIAADDCVTITALVAFVFVTKLLLVTVVVIAFVVEELLLLLIWPPVTFVAPVDTELEPLTTCAAAAAFGCCKTIFSVTVTVVGAGGGVCKAFIFVLIGVVVGVTDVATTDTFATDFDNKAFWN